MTDDLTDADRWAIQSADNLKAAKTYGRSVGLSVETVETVWRQREKVVNAKPDRSGYRVLTVPQWVEELKAAKG